MTDNIKAFKLKSGEEIIARCDNHINVDDKYKLSKVRQIVIQPIGPGQMGLAFLPWIATAQDDEILLKANHLACDPFIPPENIEKEYLQQTTGIALVK